MALTLAIARALDAHRDLDALGCVEVASGLVLSSSARDAAAREALEQAAQAAVQLCAPPPLEAYGPINVRETFLVSESSVHVFMRSHVSPRCVLVGVARGDANVALVLAMLRTLTLLSLEPVA
jgi:hypothetical protein